MPLHDHPYSDVNIIYSVVQTRERTTDRGTNSAPVHPFCNLQRRARTHAVLVIGLYELLDNPTTQLIEPPRPWKTWGCQLTFIERYGSQTDLSFT
jgi:hypothetical protein